MKSLVIVILLLILLMIWILMTKKKLVVMDENVNLAMGQLGVQVSSQFDAAMLLVDLVESYTEKDGSRLKKMIQTEYRILTARYFRKISGTERRQRICKMPGCGGEL